MSGATSGSSTSAVRYPITGGQATSATRLLVLRKSHPFTPMAPRSTFRNSALLSGLVTQAQLELAAAHYVAGAEGNVAVAEVDDKSLSHQLVEMGVLTRYQADQIQAGRTKFKLGPYIVTDWIGQGGMGQVYKAVHQVMGRESAVKVLPLHKATPDSIANFNREIRMQAQLDHPNLVRAFDAGHDGNVHFLVTEYVPGTDLRRYVRSQGAMPVQQAANVILQSARALEYAHARGLIHRDVKPGNILVTPDGLAKVSDLGLAGFLNSGEQDPRAGKIVGTADYIAPELIRSPGDVSAASDIYSLGCTLYYAVCGKVPFPGGTTKEKARRHCEETPWHPRRFRPEIPEEFVEIVADMMEKNPQARVQTATEVIQRLEPWAADAAPIVAKRLGKSPWSAPPPPTGREEEEEFQQDTESGQESSYAGSGQLSQISGGPASSSTDMAGKGSKRTANSEIVAPEIEPLAAVDPTTYIVVTLAIAVPLSMLFGAFLASLVFWMRG
jgi:eukaryotic-like serine/threonine-protein kinase